MNDENREEYFKKWADSYYESANKVFERLQKKKEEMKNCNGIDIIELSRQIEILQDSYCDCLETARILSVKAAREKAKAEKLAKHPE